MYPPQIWKVRMRSVLYRDARGVRWAVRSRMWSAIASPKTGTGYCCPQLQEVGGYSALWGKHERLA